MAETSEMLARIASALDMSIEAFSPLRDGLNDDAATLEEVADLIDVFQRIEDQQARRRFLGYIKSLAQHERLRERRER